MFSALMNAQNRGGTGTIPLTSAVFEYSNDGVNWFSIPSGGIGITYDGNSYQFRVFSVSPPGATYTSSIPSPIINSGSTAQVSVTGTGSYTGTITSGVFFISQRTINAISLQSSNPVSADTCTSFPFGEVSGFNITPSNLVTGDAGVTISIIYGTSIYNPIYGGYNFYAGTASAQNVGYVNNQIGSGNNFVVNTNASFTIYCNENDNSTGNYWWVVVNPNEWTDNTGVITVNPAYNSNYSIAVVKLNDEITEAYFDNTCV
jgi:hypothetical protein